MSILTQLRKLEKDRTRFKEIGKTATENYQALQPKYSEAVQSAKNYQSTLTEDYNRYVRDRNQSIDSYNSDLQQRYQTYQGTVQRGSGLESTYKAAQQELNRLGSLKDSYATQANTLYGTYSSAYSSGTQSGQQQYQTKLGDFQQQFQKIRQDYEGFESNVVQLNEQIRSQQRNISGQENFRNIFANSAELGGRYVVDSTNKMYRVFTDSQNRYQSAQEYGVLGGYYKGYAQALGQVNDSGYGSLTEAIKFLSSRGTKTFADAVYERYQRGASTYDTYQATANLANTYTGYVNQANQRISGYVTNIQGYQSDIRSNQQSMAGVIVQNRAVDKAYQDFIGDTGFVTRIAEQQSAGALQNYQNYLQNTYNPSVNTYNQYASGTYTPAAQAYQNFTGSGEVQRALSNYQSLAQDTGYVDRASSDTKSVYDASAKKYKDLQTAYQSLEEPLSQYVTEATTAADQIKQLNSQLPGLQRSLRVEQDPRKRETRIGYGRSLMTSGTKRRSSAR